MKKKFFFVFVNDSKINVENRYEISNKRSMSSFLIKILEFLAAIFSIVASIITICN